MTDVFTYGSLMCADIMAAVSGVNSPSEPALLRNYRRYAVLSEDYPGLVADAGAETQGLVYRNITEEGLHRLDRFEGEYYQRRDVVLELTEGKSALAQTYVFRSEYQYLLADWPWSFEHFLNVGKSRFNSDYLGFQKMAD